MLTPAKCASMLTGTAALLISALLSRTRKGYPADLQPTFGSLPTLNLFEFSKEEEYKVNTELLLVCNMSTVSKGDSLDSVLKLYLGKLLNKIHRFHYW